MEYIVLIVVIVAVLITSVHLTYRECKRSRVYKEYQVQMDKERRMRAADLALKPFEDYDNGRG
jgi:hypothetical protein